MKITIIATINFGKYSVHKKKKQQKKKRGLAAIVIQLLT